MNMLKEIKSYIPNSLKQLIKNILGSKSDNRIQIAKNTFVAKTAIIEIRRGGDIEIGESCEILDGVMLLSYGGTIKIGSGCSINPYTIIYGISKTTIGNNVLIAGHCMIIPAQHTFKDRNQTIKSQKISSKGIVIEDDVWIAHGCSILDGITIGQGAVIAAGSVVNNDVPPYSVVGGVPAKIIKMRE